MEAAPEAHERSLVESTSQSESQAQVEAEHFVASEKVLTENDYPAPEQQQRAAPRRLRAKDYPTPANEKVEAEVPQSTHSAGGLRDYPNPWAQPAQDSFLEQDANDFPAFVEMGTTIEGEAEGEADNELESLSTAISEAEGGITAATEAELEAQANAPTEEELRAQEESKQWSEAPLVDNLDTHKEAGEIANIHDKSSLNVVLLPRILLLLSLMNSSIMVTSSSVVLLTVASYNMLLKKLLTSNKWTRPSPSSLLLLLI